MDALQVLTRRQWLHQEPQVAQEPAVEPLELPIPIYRQPFALQGEKRLGEVQSPLVNPVNPFEDLLALDDDPTLLSKIKDVQSLVSSYMKQLHGGRKLHHGANRMYNDANKLFPGHRLPQSFFKDYVARCSICQKIRLQKDSAFVERV